MVLHRAQFEAAVRAVWVFYAANQAEVAKLSAALSAESEQNAKNMAQVKTMLEDLARVPAASAPHQSLSRFKEASWPALTSFAHAGIHAVQRQASGYPEALLEDIVRNSNAIAVLAAMQAAVLVGRQEVVHHVASFQASHSACMPRHVVT